MPVICKTIINTIENLAPCHLAEDWDNIGLLVGSCSQKITKVLLTLDITSEVVDEAIECGADLIITHHPVIFGSLKALRTDTYIGRILAKLMKADIAVYAAHTNLDSTFGGVSDVLAELLNLKDVAILDRSYKERLLKLVVFVPETHVEDVRRAINDAGAGYIGNYSNCTFQTSGIGTFLPQSGTNPFIGKQGHLEYVNEYRLETILPEKLHKKVIKAMLNSHPYEEVAYDLYPLLNEGESLGLGRIGRLTTAASLANFADRVKTVLSLACVKISGNLKQTVSKVAVCGGSGASLITKAYVSGADVLVTGDVKYHDAQKALSLGLAVVDAGHYATEFPVLMKVKQYLDNVALDNNWGIEIEVSHMNRDIFSFI